LTVCVDVSQLGPFCYNVFSHRSMRGPRFCCLATIAFLLYCFPLFSQSFTKPEDLAKALAAAENDEQQKRLLEQNNNLITPDLTAALNTEADTLLAKGKDDAALKIYAMAKTLAEKNQDKPGIATGHKKLSNVYEFRGNYPDAIAECQTSLQLFQQLNDPKSVGNALYTLGNLYRSTGDYPQAMDTLKKGLDAFQSIPDKGGIALIQNAIAIVESLEGNFPAAMDRYEAAAEIFEEAGDKKKLYSVLFNMGNVVRLQGDYSRAMEFYQRAISVSQELNEPLGTAYSWNGIGNIYLLQGNYDLALQYFQKSLEIKKQLAPKQSVITAMVNIGHAEELQRNYSGALQIYQQGLVEQEAIGDKDGIATGLTDIGNVYRSQRKYDDALEYYNRSLKEREALNEKKGMAEVLNFIALTYSMKKDEEKALEFAQRALDLAQQVNAFQTLWDINDTLGMIYRSTGKLDLAEASYRKAIAIVEQMRKQTTGGAQEQERFLENKVDPYYGMIDLMIGQQKDEEALNYAELIKGRVLLDVLKADRNNKPKQLMPEEQAREQEFSLRLVSLNDQLSKAQSAKKQDVDRIQKFSDEIQKTRLGFEAYRNTLYTAHPELRIVRGEMEPASLLQLSDSLLTDENALLEYVVTDEKVFLFCFTKDANQVALKSYSLDCTPADLQTLVEKFSSELAGRDPGFTESSAKLYESLLTPVLSQLAGKKDVAIVPDSFLWQVPFQALKPKNGRYLLEQFAISYAPSWNVHYAMAAKNQERATKPELLAFGNPQLQKREIERAKFVSRDATLAPLPEAEKEVRELRSIYGPEASKIYTGAEAREDRFKQEASKYDILHLATHGIVNDASPMYSQLILSEPPDNKTEDGALEAWELMQMNLNARVVVLSACETARGHIGAGEGIIGLTWALFVAGSPTTVVSQWKVESTSTAALMLQFHRNLKLQKMPPAKALQQAELKLLHTSQYMHPFYWAPFVVIGRNAPLY